MTVLQLALPTPLRRLFDYLPPADISGAQLQQLQPGQRLRVPFGRRELVGVLLAVRDGSALPESQLKPATALLDDNPVLAGDILQLCNWAADYYQHPAGEVFTAALPRQLRLGKPRETGSTKAWRLSRRGMGLPEGALPRSPKQAQALAALQATAAVSAEEFKQAGISSAVLRALEEKGLAERCRIAPPLREARTNPGLALNDDQQAALDSIASSAGRFGCHLLEGVTGSGKTEVYLQLIAGCLQRGQQALVLVPEIGLGPQTLARFQARFDADIVVLHSGLAEGARYRDWEAAAAGRAHIVIGTRSAIFAPLANPGLIVVDEEHDASYKQQDGFRYSARDLAVKRAQLADCPVVLGSATPSLESLHNALDGRYQHHHLPRRAGSAQLPTLQALDVRHLPLQASLSEPLTQRIEATLKQGQQTLLFLNRRGFAPSLQCHDCGWVADCNACDARLTVHLRQRRLRCHHCEASRPLPPTCPECHSRQLLTSGVGTEQAEAYLRERFAHWPVYRVDSDSMRGRDAMQALSDEVNRGQPCILLGTQMLTKGHHFPGVTLVAVLDADGLLFSADFRGEERMAQLLTQVAGRAGRADQPGTVILQTHHPDHPALQSLLQLSYAEQARQLLQQRRELGLPPCGQMLMLRTDATDAEAGEHFLAALRRAFEQAPQAQCQLIGPLPSPMPRRQGRYRSQLLVLARSRPAARAAAAQLVALAEGLPRSGGLNWSIDVDPSET
ncbi:primosomal protein N' [Parahaliea aestuarii]|uniref:Replication restart protein PriA n=1 Tax=Parahaliea aestuarii TaxID=1852021 RepID=A0A5C8ZZC2_9GAMM|nr:primosomal protein N' [Parahaliea aestuarii]TXS92571.1 primosomal protein N' [Parahaliea aestuarii]